MSLANVKKGKIIEPRRIMIYGVHGIGKSTFAASAPDPVFVPTEEGTNDLDIARFPVAKDFNEFMTYLHELRIEGHEFQTVVIDTLDWLEKLIHKFVAEKQDKKSIEDIGYGRGYKLAIQYWDMFFDILDKLRREKKMTVILLAHSVVTNFKDPSTESYDRYAPDLHKEVVNTIQEWCDEVFFANYQITTKTTESGFNQTRTRGLSAGDRILHTSERPSHYAKRRIDLPDQIPLQFGVYFEALKKHYAIN